MVIGEYAEAKTNCQRILGVLVVQRVQLAAEHALLPLVAAQPYGEVELGARLVDPAEPGEQLAADARQQVRAMASELVRRFQQREKKTLLTDAELWVAPEVWQRALDLLTEASALVHDSANAPRADGSVPVNLTVAAFRMRS